MGARAAREANRNPRPDVDTRSCNQNGGAQAANSSEQNRKLSIVIHGLKIDKEQSMLESVLDMCQEMKAIVFASDIDDIQWLGHF